MLMQSLKGQEILTLRDCYEMAMAASALSGEKEAYAKIHELKDENLTKVWLPTLDANGSFIYNSDVIDMSGAFASIPLPGIEDAFQPLPNEQYKINVEISQTFYDGGFTKNSRIIEEKELNINEKQTETDMYKIRAQINSYYFNLMLSDRHKDLLTSYLELITKRLSSMQSAVDNGVILKSDLDVLTSEKIKIEQQLSETEIKKASLLKGLSSLTGKNIDQTAKFSLPVISDTRTNEILRPELQMFDLRKDQITASINLVESKRRPKAFGFATLGFGNPPGSDLFRDEFAPYYILGAGVKWNIFDWNRTGNEKQMIIHQQGIIDSRKKDLTDNIMRMLEIKEADILSLSSLTEKDLLLITLRKRITASSESQYENGTITATELINEMNAEQQALINYEIHKINLALAKVEYLNISGEEIE
jgi:outer membrane protein TolC